MTFPIFIPIFITIIILSSTTLLILFSATAVYGLFPPSTQELAIVRHKSSPPQAPLPNQGNTIIRSSPSSQPSTVSTSPNCITYNPSTRTISVSCSNPARLTDIDNKLHDNSILAKESPGGVWFLSANLVIAKGATFHIDSTDTKRLKISSKVTRTGVAKIAPAYIIDVHGSLKIDSVKITSWDPTTNYYAITNGSRTGSGVFIFGAPRPSIIVENNATGTTDITNSEIAYLGYEQGKHKGGSGLSYYYVMGVL